jgi:hypothetical protein
MDVHDSAQSQTEAVDNIVLGKASVPTKKRETSRAIRDLDFLCKTANAWDVFTVCRECGL